MIQCIGGRQSHPRRARSVKLMLRKKESETACVPGPFTAPMGAVPNRPMLFAGTAKAAAFNH